MELVTDLWQIDDNLDYLDTHNVGTVQPDREYAGYIQRGTVLLPYLKLGKIAFAPSRFIGYVNNTFEKHTDNPEKDGRDTTPRITSLLGEAVVHAGLDEEYRLFCDGIGAKPGDKGSRGAPRRFWSIYRTSKLFRGSAQ